MSIHDEVDYSKLIDQLRGRADSLNKYIDQNNEDKVTAWAQKITYSFKIYSSRVTE